MSAAKLPSWVSCVLGLTLIDAGLRLLGLRRTFALARRLGGRAVEKPEFERPPIRETAHRVATVAAFYPRRARCLEQSVLLYLLLRRRGVPVELRLGVQPFPFVAHAWVEHRGRPVNESRDFVARLAAFPSLGG